MFGSSMEVPEEDPEVVLEEAPAASTSSLDVVEEVASATCSPEEFRSLLGSLL